MKRNIQREWVLLMREESGLVTWVFEPLRKKELAVRLRRGWVKKD